MPRPAADATSPLFSVVTVCRNAERSIARTIESVQSQIDYHGCLEHLIIDGASTDGTLAVVRRYPHLRVLSEPDSGIYDAMNKGVSRSRGELIGLLNADDWYEPGALALVAAEFRAHPEVSIVHGDIRRWQHGKAMDVAKPARDRGIHGTRVMPILHPACFARRAVFDRFGQFDLSYKLFADYDWLRRVVRGGVAVRYCPEVLTNFTMGGATTTRLEIREQYRVVRAHGASPFAALGTVAHTCAVVIRNRLRGSQR